MGGIFLAAGGLALAAFLWIGCSKQAQASLAGTHLDRVSLAETVGNKSTASALSLDPARPEASQVSRENGHTAKPLLQESAGLAVPGSGSQPAGGSHGA